MKKAVLYATLLLLLPILTACGNNNANSPDAVGASPPPAVDTPANNNETAPPHERQNGGENCLPKSGEDAYNAAAEFALSGKGELLRTGEFITAEQMEILKNQALSWQSVITGMGGFAHVVAIEPTDDSEQQVFISVVSDQYDAMYEKMLIQAPEGVQAEILSTGSGAGSGELIIRYRFFAENFEWIEFFFTFPFDVDENAAPWQWQNITEEVWQFTSAEAINLLLTEGQFK